VLRVLGEAGIPIDCVAGTSVGALIGAGYCAGASLEKMQEIGALTSFTDFWALDALLVGPGHQSAHGKYLARFSPLKTFRRIENTARGGYNGY